MIKIAIGFMLFGATGVNALTTIDRKAFFSNLAGVAAGMAIARPAKAFDPQTFNHQYSDPKHPNCKRIVVVRKDGTASLSGTDGSPGCPEDGSGNVWRLVGEVEVNQLAVDFSPKVCRFFKRFCSN